MKRMLIPRSSKAFSLVEILITVSLIILLAVLILAALGKARANTKVTLTKAQISNIWKELNVYYQSGGSKSIPANSTCEEIVELLIEEEVFDVTPIDAWDQPIVFDRSNGFDIYSLGPDGVESDDDIRQNPR